MAATAPFDLLLDISARVRSDGTEARLRMQPHWTGGAPTAAPASQAAANLPRARAVSLEL